MKSRIATLTALLALLTISPAFAKSVKRPTPAQMRAAVARAERSKNLWATVNICDTRHHPNMIGIRGQMPALGFPASLTMIIKLDYYSLKTAGFRPVPHVRMRDSLGTASTGFHQAGGIFPFKPPVAPLSGTITFQWRIGKRLLGQATRLTGHGYKGVDNGDPPGTSHAVCRIS
ncbi:MAG: hypothetical protein M3Z06_10765 [Actinomycetota bacterium]|nr:hypothetical protein [Actinomycetota bacterium]